MGRFHFDFATGSTGSPAAAEVPRTLQVPRDTSDRQVCRSSCLAGLVVGLGEAEEVASQVEVGQTELAQVDRPTEVAVSCKDLKIVAELLLLLRRNSQFAMAAACRQWEVARRILHRQALVDKMSTCLRVARRDPCVVDCKHIHAELEAMSFR
jgi:hypothetical protein